MENIIKELRLTIEKDGFTQRDNRLNRAVQALLGASITLDQAHILELEKKEVLPKYEEDWSRMYGTFRLACKNALSDQNSRRLVILNTSKFSKVYPCFTQIQFVKNNQEFFDMYIYLRSSDLEKLNDDCVFFANIASKFGKKVKNQVSKMVIFFGNVHYEIKN